MFVIINYKFIDVLISTPLRIIAGIRDETISLKSIKHLVIDEADKLFDMGFLSQIDEIIHACNSDVSQTTTAGKYIFIYIFIL